ncbi:MAG: FmdB family transcriptional regulator [Actinobacteria bacterium]|nr:FmdB family transcriptional regulator [Actinomycetota bacterium]
MPTYDYRCERTGEMFELWQSFADDALTTCPQVHEGEPDECGAGVRKVFSKVGIAFKGDGCYKNDHGSTAKSRPSETSSSSSSGDTSSSSDSSSKSESSSSDSSSKSESSKSDSSSMSSTSKSDSSSNTSNSKSSPSSSSD